MGKIEKEANSLKLKAEEYTSSQKDKRKRKTPTVAASIDDDAEANEDLSLKIVQKSMQRAANINSRYNGVSEIVTDLKEEKGKKEKKKRKKSKEIEVLGDIEDNIKDKKKPEVDNAVEVSSEPAQISNEAAETNPVEVSDNVVLRKLLRGPRYFDPPDNNSWGACYNCGEEGHTTVNCTSARRKKPCFVCGSFEHNAKLCSKGRDCFTCKQQGHRAKDCPDRYNSSKICLKCGDLGHDMFSCSNDYCPDDLKEIKCYICGKFGHLCCRNYEDAGPREVTCYRCGLSGHTGLACQWSCGDTNDTAYASSCYKCGLVGHFARECTNSKKAGKRKQEPSTPKQRSSKKNWDHMEVKSGPHDSGKSWKKKKSQSSEYASASNMKHRGGWSTEDPGDYDNYSSKSKANNWRSPSTPKNRRSSTEDPGDYDNYSSKSKANNWRSPSTSKNRRPNFHSPNGDYASGSRSAKSPYNNMPSNGSARFYENRYSASRFGNSNGGMGRNNDWW